MSEFTLLGAAWFVVTALVGAVMWAAQIGPKAAASNLADWATWFGFKSPQWLRSPRADRIVRRGGPLILGILAMVGVWIFWSLEAAVFTGCVELIGFALFALRRRSRDVGIALIIVSFLGLGVGLWIVISSKAEAPRVTNVAAEPTVATPAIQAGTQPGSGNPLQDSINALLEKRGKRTSTVPAAVIGAVSDNYTMGDASDGRGPYITHWGSDLGPWPSTADGFTESQLRKEPSRLIYNPFDWTTHISQSPYNGTTRIDSLMKIARNESSEEVILNDAYIISGITSEKREMEVEVENKWVPVSEIMPIPPGARVGLRVLFQGQAGGGITEEEFFKDWSKIYFVYSFNGKKPVRQLMDEKIFKPIFDNARPKPNTEPRVTLRKTPPVIDMDDNAEANLKSIQTNGTGTFLKQRGNSKVSIENGSATFPDAKFPLAPLTQEENALTSDKIRGRLKSFVGELAAFEIKRIAATDNENERKILEDEFKSLYLARGRTIASLIISQTKVDEDDL